MDGIAVDRIVGFEDLGAADDFPEIILTRRILRSGVLKALTREEKGRIVIKRGVESDDSDSNDDY